MFVSFLVCSLSLSLSLSLSSSLRLSVSVSHAQNTAEALRSKYVNDVHNSIVEQKYMSLVSLCLGTARITPLLDLLSNVGVAC